jgi:hypothetical protein
VAQGIINELEFAREAPSASILTSSPSYTLSGLRNITQFRVGKISRLRRQYLSKSFMTVFHIRPSARAKYPIPRISTPLAPAENRASTKRHHPTLRGGVSPGQILQILADIIIRSCHILLGGQSKESHRGIIKLGHQI